MLNFNFTGHIMKADTICVTGIHFKKNDYFAGYLMIIILIMKHVIHIFQKCLNLLNILLHSLFDASF